MADVIKGDVQAAIDAGMVMADRDPTAQFTVIPASSQVVCLEQYHDKPRRVRQNVVLNDLTSFLTYVKRFKQFGTTIFRDPDKATFAAIIDFHKTSDSPEWCSHVAKLQLQQTDEWTEWRAADQKQMQQFEFAEFIESHYGDITNPPAAAMLEIALEFQARKDVNFSSGVRLQNGQVQFTYNETLGASTKSGTVEIPSTFEIAIAPFKGQQRTPLSARLRYRLKDHRLLLWYELIRPGDVLDKSLAVVADKIHEETTLFPLTGSVAGK